MALFDRLQSQSTLNFRRVTQKQENKIKQGKYNWNKSQNQTHNGTTWSLDETMKDLFLPLI